MAVTNYGELKTSIANHMHRDDLTASIPDFILFSESTISGSPEPVSPDQMGGIRTRDQVSRYTATITSEFETIPSNMMSIRDAQINTDPVTPLEYLTPAEMTRKYPSFLTGTPKHYTVHGDEFQFKPVPSTSFTLELSIVTRYAAFSLDADTNWLLTNHPLVYVYSALVAASSYVGDDPSKWVSLYKSLASNINGAEDDHPSRLSTRISTATP